MNHDGHNSCGGGHRADRAARRAARFRRRMEAWGVDPQSLGLAGWGDPADWSADAPGGRSPRREQIDELQSRVAGMESIIAGLTERVKVLERIVVSAESAERRLAEEIERLRDKGASASPSEPKAG
ncbi:hypothetical protein GC169_02000 [bacterium]|nr:hypothetical protein [bacterium]